ncbi:MAG: NAD(P)H-binding protein [Deltaproteobacteria bacterium]|nr:NAD(P)H-binding protein [Deltaproteobacteria bacterium]
MTSKPLHVIFGAGQVGSLLAKQLRAAGLPVRVVRRQAQSSSDPDLQVVQADVYDREAAVRAAAGASVVYHCVNAPYHQWPTQLPPLHRHIAAAAQNAGARLVLLDNVYMVGPTSAPFGEYVAEQPCSKKGMIRKQLSDELREQARRGELRLTIGRASDFVGPGVTQGAIQNPRGMQQLLGGKTVDLLGSPDQPHSWSYVPDVAAGLAALGQADAAVEGEVFHLPVLPPETARERLQGLATELGVGLQVRAMPAWLLRGLGWFSPLMAEFGEMRYQFDQPMVLRDEKIRTRLGLQPTARAQQLRETAAWLRA